MPAFAWYWRRPGRREVRSLFGLPQPAPSLLLGCVASPARLPASPRVPGIDRRLLIHPSVFPRQVWVNTGDIVLVGLRDYQDEKADVILK